MQVTWVKSEADTWLKLTTFDLSSIGTKRGVYMIWHTGKPGRVVRVGQGDIAARLTEHREDPAILAYDNLRVTWATVSAAQLDGVERYLADHWKPLIGDRFPNVVPIPVNSPFAA
jgi:hypothetical protein